MSTAVHWLADKVISTADTLTNDLHEQGEVEGYEGEGYMADVKRMCAIWSDAYNNDRSGVAELNNIKRIVKMTQFIF